ncbi:MAG: hypothetical protein AB7G06_08845 [Bdellovibrionales bacterium]
MKKPSVRLLYIDHAGPYEKVPTALVPFIAAYRKARIPCKNMAAQYLDDPRTFMSDSLRARIGCVLDFFPAQPPKGMKTITIPGGTFVRIERTGKGWPRQWRDWWLAERYAEENGWQPTAGVLENYDLSIQRRGWVEMLMPVKRVK